MIPPISVVFWSVWFTIWFGSRYFLFESAGGVLQFSYLFAGFGIFLFYLYPLVGFAIRWVLATLDNRKAEFYFGEKSLYFVPLAFFVMAWMCSNRSAWIYHLNRSLLHEAQAQISEMSGPVKSYQMKIQGRTFYVENSNPVRAALSLGGMSDSWTLLILDRTANLADASRRPAMLFRARPQSCQSLSKEWYLCKMTN